MTMMSNGLPQVICVIPQPSTALPDGAASYSRGPYDGSAQHTSRRPATYTSVPIEVRMAKSQAARRLRQEASARRNKDRIRNKDQASRPSDTQDAKIPADQTLVPPRQPSLADQVNHSVYAHPEINKVCDAAAHPRDRRQQRKELWARFHREGVFFLINDDLEWQKRAEAAERAETEAELKPKKIQKPQPSGDPPCVQCALKGMWCSVLLMDRQAEVRCQRCERSGEEFCIRLAGDVARTAQMSRPFLCKNKMIYCLDKRTRFDRTRLLDAAEALLHGDPRYVNGILVSRGDVARFALPWHGAQHRQGDDGPEPQVMDHVAYFKEKEIRREEWKEVRRQQREALAEQKAEHEARQKENKKVGLDAYQGGTQRL